MKREIISAALLLAGITATAKEKPVNVVFFIADDLGIQDIGPYGNLIVKTPNLDQLARESVQFNKAFAASPTCAPSRASIHTGLMPFRNGAHANHTGIKEGVKTLPVYARANGYRAAIAGKLHIGPDKQYPFEKILKTNVPEPGHEGQGVLWTDLNMEPVDQWLGEVSREKTPFILVVNDHSPHVYWPEKAEYPTSEMDIPPVHIDTKETREARARYYTDISKMDNNLGKLVKSLEYHGLSNNTVIIFTCDQGPQWAFGKWGLYDYGIHVPLLIKWPGVVSEHRESNALVSLVDLLPTCIELSGGEVPIAPAIDGRSLVPLLRGEQVELRTEVFASHTGDGKMNQSPMRMIRNHRFKYILNIAPDILYTTHMDKGKEPYWDSWVDRSFESEQAAWVLWRYHNRPKEELYDIQMDPFEIKNLAKDPHYKEIINIFREKMQQWRRSQGDEETGPYDAVGQPNVAPYIF